MITTWSRGEPAGFMPEAILTRLVHQVRRHPWWQARARLVLAILRRAGILPPAHVLDAGCGWGVTLEALEAAGYRTAGLDISRHALERLDGPGRQLIEADLTRLDIPRRSVPAFDAVLALDLIEHLDDDRAAVADLGVLLRPGGLLVVTVPALPELYSEFDRVQGHRRRYRPEDLRAAFGSSGLDLVQVSWWGQWLVPFLRVRRGRPRRPAGGLPEEVYRRYLALPPWPLPWLFRRAFAWEQDRTLDGRLRRGTSLLALARRPYGASRKNAMTPWRISSSDLVGR
jgi:SAM-dependent methyltransferase